MASVAAPVTEPWTYIGVISDNLKSGLVHGGSETTEEGIVNVIGLNVEDSQGTAESRGFCALFELDDIFSGSAIAQIQRSGL